MCENCYKDAGAPYEDTEKVRRAVDLMYRAEADNHLNDHDTGMHLVTGNWNIEDGSIQWCLDNADLTSLERELCNLMLTMSLDERNTAMAIYCRLARPLAG